MGRLKGMKAIKRTLLGLVALVAIFMSGYFFQHDIYDWFKLRNYTPSPEVVSLADKTTMLPGARRLFYVNHPVVADKQTFNSFCRIDEHSIVLGCYLSGQRGIYLLGVDDERLNGIEEVTAAHELLHAAYERLNSKDKERIDSLLQDALEATKDPRIIETIESYRRHDPAVVYTEMHSVFGTEVMLLNQELEDYYARYFSERQQIVRLADKYEQAFADRKNKIRQLDIELDALRIKIDNSTTLLKRKDAALKDMRHKMAAYRSADDVAAYNKQVDEYNRFVNEVDMMIVRYNDLVQERNNISTEDADLIKSIDSRDVVPEDR